MFKTLKYQIPAISWALIILILCDLPQDNIPGHGLFFEGFDKIVHLGFFFVLTVFLFYGKIKQQNSYEYRLITIIKI